MIKRVFYDKAEWADIPEKFEAGTSNIAGTIGLAESIKYLNKIGMQNIENWEKQLTSYALQKMKNVSDIEIYNSGAEKSSGIISFTIKGIHPHDVANIMNNYGIAIRAGHNCVMPLMEKLNAKAGVSRVSFYFYNTFEDVDKFIYVLNKIKNTFK
jgi:cysteine desulfurase/selenocysteine lyase